MQTFRISVMKRSKKKLFHSFQAKVSKNHITIKGLVKQSRCHQVEWKARSESKFWLEHISIWSRQRSMQETLQEVAEEEVSLRYYHTYLDDSIE